MIIKLPFADEITDIYSEVIATPLGNNYYHIPINYIQSYSGNMVINLRNNEDKITGGRIDDGNVQIQTYGIELIYPNNNYVEVELYSN